MEFEDSRALSDFWVGFQQSLFIDKWLARSAVTVTLILFVYFARRYQLKLLKQTQSELDNELYSRFTAEESTNITEESLQTVQNRPENGGRVLPVEESLDDAEYASAERACQITREFIQQKEAIEALLTQAEPANRPSRLTGKERELAAKISENFEQLNGLWNANKETSDELKTLVKTIAQRLGNIPSELNNDRVAASQCMSICCTAILKYDGLYVLDAIRNVDVDLANDCQGIIETAVPFIWAT